MAPSRTPVEPLAIGVPDDRVVQVKTLGAVFGKRIGTVLAVTGDGIDEAIDQGLIEPLPGESLGAAAKAPALKAVRARKSAKKAAKG